MAKQICVAIYKQWFIFLAIQTHTLQERQRVWQSSLRNGDQFITGLETRLGVKRKLLESVGNIENWP